VDGSPVVDWLRSGMDVRHSNGEVTSFPPFTLEALPDGQRILHYATTERFVVNADGSLGPLVEGSTKVTSLTLSVAAEQTQFMVRRCADTVIGTPVLA
jgi:hypothetical protein